MRISFKIASLAVSLLLLTGSPAAADNKTELTSMSLEQLMELNVTTVSKKSQHLQEAAAAVFVITKEDIRRSGATSLPEVLRMVPGLNIGRTETGEWAVSSRGFMGVFADRLLTLIDGRTIFTPIFSGTWWDSQDLVLEDINRIEVIRGPGATLWGANAVNGVINIITDSAAESQGAQASVLAGNEDRFVTAARHGGKVGNTNYKLWAKYADRDESELESGGEAADEWRTVRSGIRADSELSGSDHTTLEGEFYHLNSGLNFLNPSLTEPDFVDEEDGPRSAGGGHVLGRWTRDLKEGSDLTFQTYYNRDDRNDHLLESTLDLYDFELQHRLRPLDDHELIWGIGYRYYHDHFENSEQASVVPESRDIALYTGFIQDDLTLIDDYWHLIFGTKLENNAFSGWEIQPTIRTIVTPTQDTALWAAVSRAVRSPARFNRNGHLDIAAVPTEAGLPGLVTLSGDTNYDSGTLVAYEVGARHEFGNTFSADVAAFFNNYGNIDTSDASDPFFSDDPQPHIEIPLKLADGTDGRTWGAEAAINVRPWSWWRIVTAYSFLQMELNQSPGDPVYGQQEEESPQNQLHIRSLIDLPHNLEFDATLRYVDRIASYDIDAYTELDLRLGWKPCPNFELSVVGQNLLDDSHQEFTSNFISAAQSEIERAFYIKGTFKY